MNLEEALQRISRLELLLAHAVELADTWYGDSQGGKIECDPLIDEARKVISKAQDDAT